MDTNKELVKFLAEAGDWARLQTSVNGGEGVAVVKMPTKNNYPERLSVQVNPTGKRNGIYIRDELERETLARVLASEDLKKLVAAVAAANPTAKKTGTILEI